MRRVKSRPQRLPIGLMRVDAGTSLAIFLIAAYASITWAGELKGI
jgi:hypothetical protein